MEIELFDLEPWQRDALKAHIAHPQGTTIIVKSQRQVGKSVYIIALLLYEAINHPGSTSMLVSPTLRQSKKIFKELRRVVRDTGLLAEVNNSELTMEFTDGSTLLFNSVEQRDAIRGNTISGVLCIDEAAFCQSEVVYDLLPMVNVRNANVVMTSTPKFSTGVFYDLYNRGMSGDANIISLDWTTYDTSKYMTEERKKFYKSIFPKLQYQCEIEGQFINAQSVVFGDFLECIKATPYTGEDVVLGIDWATGTDNDSTVLTFIGQRSRAVYEFDGFNDLNAIQTIDRIMRKLTSYNVRRVLVEGNSIGQVYYDLLYAQLRNRHITVSKFQTTNDSKRTIIEDLAVAFQDKRLTIPPDEVAKYQLSMYEIEATPTGKITYNGGMNAHDDYVMSLAIALYGTKTAQYTVR